MSSTTPRRTFIRTAIAAGALATARKADAAAAGEGESLVPKVRAAMLAMQRRAWEQGTAAQALLEWGDIDLVVLLAKDALVNQAKDGRLGLNGDKGPVCDPASNGEPVLAAWRATGDPAFKTAADRMLDFLLYQAPRTRKGLLYHNSRPHARGRAREGRPLRPRAGGLRRPELRPIGHGDRGPGLLPSHGSRSPGWSCLMGRSRAIRIPGSPHRPDACD